MNNLSAPHYRPMAMWRWSQTSSQDDHCFALDQAARQELGGLVIEHHTLADSEALASTIAAGAERVLMMWIELSPPSVTGVNPLHPGDVMQWLETQCAPRLLRDNAPHHGLSGILLPAAHPPVPIPGDEWDPIFLEAFLDQKGYAPGAANADHPHVRADVHDVYTTLLAAAWYGMAGEWCDEHNLNLIACVAHGNTPDAAALAKYTNEIDIPAIRFPIHQLDRHACMTVHSAAKLALRPRTAAILDHGPLHTYSLDTLKDAVDTLVTAGIDLIVVDGFGPLDTNTGLSYQIPQWHHVHRWSRYTAMLCEQFSAGRDIAPVAVLDPGRSIAAAVNAAPIADEFQAVRDALDEEHIGYVTLDEQACSRLVAADNRLFVRGRWFDALVVPPVTHLLETTVAALRRLALESRVFVIGAGDIEVLPAAGHARLQSPRHVSLRAFEGVMHAYSISLLRSHFFKHAFPAPLITGNLTRCRHVERDETVWSLCLNPSGRDITNSLLPARQLLNMRWPGNIAAWDHCAQGFQSVYTENELTPEGVQVAIPAHPAMLFQLSSGTRDAVPDGYADDLDMIWLTGTWHFTPHNGNMLPIRRWPFEVTVSEPIANVRLELPQRGQPASVTCDGNPLESDASDPSIFPISGRLAAGTHQFNVEPHVNAPHRAYLRGDFKIQSDSPHTLGPVRDIEVGPWDDRGFPYFSGAATYISEIEVPEDKIGIPCQLGLLQAHGAVEIEINGHTVEVLCWPPYRVPVTKWLRPGSNLVTLTVSNTLANMLHGPDKAFPSGLMYAPYLEFDPRSQSE